MKTDDRPTTDCVPFAGWRPGLRAACVVGHRRALLRGPVLAAAILLHALHAPAAAQNSPVDGTIRGEVIDETSGAPVVGATVDLLDNVNRIRARATTDENGAFLLTRIDPGAFRLRVRSVGYAELVTPRWWIASGEAITVVIRVDAEAILLAPLEVVGRTQSASPVLSGFYQRLQYNVGGIFFTREDIEQRVRCGSRTCWRRSPAHA